MSDSGITFQINDDVRIITRPEHEVVVQRFTLGDWVDVKSFHSISDDYAWHNARELAARIAKGATP